MVRDSWGWVGRGGAAQPGLRCAVVVLSDAGNVSLRGEVTFSYIRTVQCPLVYPLIFPPVGPETVVQSVRHCWLYGPVLS